MANKISEEDIWKISDKQQFGKFTVRRINIEEWQVLIGNLIQMEGTETKVAKYLNHNLRGA